MLVFIPAETRAGERRVGLTPEGAQKLIKLGLTVSIQEGAGQASGYHDDEYKAAGASIAGISAISTADVVATVRPLENDAIGQLKSGAITISFLSPANDAQTVKALADKKVTALSFDVLPRISRAQSMDALTSQALCAGYRTVLIAVSYTHLTLPTICSV